MISKGGIRVKSYALAIAVAMLVAAGYAFQNTGDVTVRFLVWERQIPQGVWEVLLFAAGGILMWFVSLVALLEVRSGLKREIRDLRKREEEHSEERTALLAALANNPRGAAQECLSPTVSVSPGEKSASERSSTVREDFLPPAVSPEAEAEEAGQERACEGSSFQDTHFACMEENAPEEEFVKVNGEQEQR